MIRLSNRCTLEFLTASFPFQVSQKDLKSYQGEAKVWAIFWFILVYTVCIMTKADQVVVVSTIEVVGALTRCALLHTVCHLKATQRNMKFCMIRELLYQFELNLNTWEVTKIIFGAKSESAVDLSRNFARVAKNLD